MNKSELIEVISEKSRIPKKRAEEVVNLVFDAMTDALVKGDRIEIRGFGSFVNREYGKYTGRNPRTGESIQVDPKKLPFFKVGKELKERVDGKAPPPEKKPGPISAQEMGHGEAAPHNPSSH
jgi:integration host factor subunit beta